MDQVPASVIRCDSEATKKACAQLSQLGKRLRAQRLAKSIPQAELAALSGVGLGTIKQLESNGKVTLETLVRVVRVLELDAELQGLFTLSVPANGSMAQLPGARARQRARRPRGVTMPAVETRNPVLQ